jgi:hypothetical protein
MTIHSDEICDYFHFNFNLPTPPHPNNAKWFVNVYTPDGKTSCFCGLTRVNPEVSRLNFQEKFFYLT